MLVEELYELLREKEQALQRIRTEARHLEKEIETLRAAIKILDSHAKSPTPVESKAAPVKTAAETIRKAFP